MKTIMITSFLTGFCLAKSIIQPQIEYFYNREGVSSCAESSIQIPCVTEMHITDTNYYYPYYVWNTYEKNQTDLYYTMWFNFNNTQSIVLNTYKCDSLYHSATVKPSIFENLHFEFNLTFQSYCKYSKDTDMVKDFAIFQETGVDNKLQSNFTLFKFKNWTVRESNIDLFLECLPVMEMQKIPPPSDTVCKNCKNN